MNSTYRLLRFSPIPEFVDPVNVALVTNDGALRLFYDKEFRRLRCVAPDFNTATLSYVLDFLASRTGTMDDKFIVDYIAGQSAQFELTAPRPLEATAGPNVIAALIDNYLHQLRDRSAVTRESDRGYIESTLSQFLARSAVVSEMMLRKRARPSTFLRTPRARNLFRDSNLSIKRVVDGDHGLVLIDGIDLTVGTNVHLGNRVASIAHAYYMFGKHRSVLERLEARTVRRAAIVFNIGSRAEDSHRDYFVNQLERESDLMVDPANGASVSELRLLCGAAVGQ